MYHEDLPMIVILTVIILIPIIRIIKHRRRKYDNIVKEIEMYNKNMDDIFGESYIKLYIGKTNLINAKIIESRYHHSYICAQKLLVTTQDFLKNKDYQSLQYSLNALVNSLTNEKYIINFNDVKECFIKTINFLSMISSAFPNWHKEYIFLNKYLHESLANNIK